jgi:hypothetical protein
LLGFISTTRIFGTFFEYVIRWMSPLVAMWVAAALWSCWRTWQSRVQRSADGRLLTVGVAVLAAVACLVTALGVARAATAEIPYERDSAIAGALSSQLAGVLDHSVRYQINELDPVALGSVAFGLALELERHGVRAGVGPWGTAGVMPFRVVDDEHAQSTLWYVATTPTITAISALPGAVVRASFDVRSAAEVQRSDRLEADLLQALCAAERPELRALLYARWGDTALAFTSGLPSTVAPLLQQYVDLRQPSAVIELPVGVNAYDVAPTVPDCVS